MKKKTARDCFNLRFMKLDYRNPFSRRYSSFELVLVGKKGLGHYIWINLHSQVLSYGKGTDAIVKTDLFQKIK